MDRLIEQLKFEEGLKLSAYLCTQGKRTIGHGHNLDAKPNFHGAAIPGRITKGFALALLFGDIADTIKELDSKCPFIMELDGARKAAFINMGFQMGTDRLMKFKNMIKAAQSDLWGTAADEALDSDWARQTPERAERVAYQIRTGLYYECK